MPSANCCACSRSVCGSVHLGFHQKLPCSYSGLADVAIGSHQPEKYRQFKIRERVEMKVPKYGKHRKKETLTEKMKRSPDERQTQTHRSLTETF